MHDIFLVHLTPERWRELNARVDTRWADANSHTLEENRATLAVTWQPPRASRTMRAANDNTHCEDEAA